jgi:tRNA dimethylallyltransferase
MLNKDSIFMAAKLVLKPIFRSFPQLLPKTKLKRKKTLLVIVGPTAVGKTGVAIALGKYLKTEIISADSRQIYRELNIGTAKPDSEELAAVKHHFINSHHIEQDYDAAQYGEDALSLINNLFESKDVLILCGGSGLYVKAVCEGFDDIPATPPDIREQIIKNYNENGLVWLQDKMKELDPDHYKNIDHQNPHRLIRALEVFIGTGASISTFQRNQKLNHHFEIIKIGLELPREELYLRIDSRMDAMVAKGLFKEAEELIEYKNKNALQTVGYQEIFDYLDKKYDYEEAVRLLKRNSRRYAKRQMTWFKRDGETEWFNPSDINGILKTINGKIID